MEEIKKKELHVSKLITEMPKLEMTYNARLVLYTVLKKVWQTFRNDEYSIFTKDVLTTEDYIRAQKPITLNLSELKPLFSLNAPFKEIKEHILTIPYEARFKTHIDIYGKYQKDLLDTKISLFSKVQANDKNKEITFKPSDNLLIYLECLKSFAKIDIEELKKLRGNYQIRGYEFVCQNNYLDSDIVKDEARKIRIMDLRRYFEVPKTYTIGDIDRRVLKPIKNAINQHTKFNITNIKKFKLDPQNKNRVTHYRIDIEYKKNNINSKENEFEKIWNLYPLQKGKADITEEDKINIVTIGYEKMKLYIERYSKYIKERRKEFNQAYMNPVRFFRTGYIDYTDENYKKYISNQSKPAQSNNFDQREYDDDFFDSLYDNFKE
jgi:hypothetical protein